MPKKPTRPLPPPPEVVQAEAAALKKIWDNTPDRPSQAQFGHDFDIGNQAAVGFFLNGDTALSLKAAKGFARGLKCLVGDFSPRLAAEIAEYARYAGVGWPFPRVDADRWEALAPEDRGYLQGVLNTAMDLLLAEGKPSLPTYGAVRADGLQSVTPSGRVALPPAAPAQLTADQAHSVGTVEGGNSDISHQNGSVESQTDRGRSARSTGKGRTR